MKIPKPKDEQEAGDQQVPLPQTLVRIPTEQAPLLQEQAAGTTDEGGT